MTDKLKVKSFEIDYEKSDLEKGLEEVLKNYNIKLTRPKFINECKSGETTYTVRNAKINDKLTLNYRRDLPIYDSLNFGQAISTTEWIFLDFDAKGGFGNENGGYAFDLDTNSKLMTECEDGLRTDLLAPNYKGALDLKHVINKEGNYKTPKITKDKFLVQFNKLLGGYISNGAK